MGTAVLLLAHGSPVPAANADLHEQVAQVRRQTGYEIVEPAFLEGASPSIPEGIDACVAQGADAVLVIPYFLLPGRHVVRDLPEFVQEAKVRHPHVQFVLGESLSGHQRLSDIVLERVAATGFPLRRDTGEKVCYNEDMSTERGRAHDGAGTGNV